MKQRSKVIWIIGLSGSGKSTMARGLENSLHEKGFITKLLDGDNLRAGINKNLGFSEEDRIENIRRAAETSKLFLECGIVTICSFITPTEEIRAMARDIIGRDDYIEVFVNCPVEICEQRDVKGLYAKARKGEILNFTGINAPFEAPVDPQLEIRTDLYNEQESLDMLVDSVLKKITHEENKHA
jgi:adenylylsulfate kinase